MQCNLTKDCLGTLQINPNQNEAIKHSLTCDICKETKIEQRTKQELIDLYIDRIAHLESGWSIEEIYNAEALDMLRGLKVSGIDSDLKNFPIAEAISERLMERVGKSV